MKRLKLLVAAALLGLPLVACEEGTAPPPVGEIDGTVVIESQGIDGVTVTLSSGAATTTSGGGHYSFTDVEAGTYTITISGYPADADFNPASAEVTIASAGQKVTRNFSGEYIRTSSLQGQVTVEGKPLVGVTVSISGRSEDQMATDANGEYKFTGLRAGTYTVTVSGFAADVAFASESHTVTVGAGQTGVWNTDATYVRESTIAGQVSVEGNGLAGVTVSLQGMGADETETTDAGGQFNFPDLRAGDYQLAISGFDAREYGFSTTTATVKVEHGKTANVPFEGIRLRTASIMGQVTVEGEGLPNVTVSLSGEGESQSTTTDDSGQYTFSELPAGNFQVGISGYDPTDYSFETTSKSVALALGATETVPFEGILLRTSGISGRVSVDGDGLGGVTVTLTGEEDRTGTTDASGLYAIAGLAAGDYTVTISGYDAVEYAFEDSQDVTLVKDSTAIVNFMGKNLRTASVAVMVTADGAGVAGVDAELYQVTNPATLAGRVIANAKTGDDGGHTFGDLLAGMYMVQISGADEEIDFEATRWMGTVATDATADATFAGEINRTASIAGSVMVDGKGMAGVAVALTGGEEDMSAKTGDDGGYSFTGLRRGEYTVTITNPDTAMYDFADNTSQDVSLGVAQAQKDVSFAGSTRRESGISGLVSVEGTPLGGVKVTLSGADEGEQTTGDDGLYNFANLGSGTYTVTITNPDETAYTFDPLSATVELGNDDRQKRNFDGMHTREGRISGMLYVDEAGNNDSRDEGEDALAVADVQVTLTGPNTLAEADTAVTDSTGAFAFEGLRQGTYQLRTGSGAVDSDYAYGGPAGGYTVTLGVGDDATATQDLPFDITHQTINFKVTLRSGETPGPALKDATVTLYSDAKGQQRVGTGTTDEDGMTAIRFARAGTTGSTVHARVAAPEGDDNYHADADLQAVTWDAKSPMADAENEGDLLSLDVSFKFAGATREVQLAGEDEPRGGRPLGEWAIEVTSGDKAVDKAPTELEDDGTAKFSETLTKADLPKTYEITVAAAQDDKLDGGESHEADTITHMHDGLSLPAEVDKGSLTVTYTTQTLKVYTYHERDQAWGYTGNTIGGDSLISGMIDVEIRYIDSSDDDLGDVRGRSRMFTKEEWDPKNMKDTLGLVTFRKVPAQANVMVITDKAAGSGDIRLLDTNGHSDELFAFRNPTANGLEHREDGSSGMFGANGGYHHTVELCPLRKVDPTKQDHGDCASFAYVNTHSVTGTATMKTIATNNAEDFGTVKTVGKAGTTFALNPVDGKNIVFEGDAFKAATKNDSKTAWDDRTAFNFDPMHAGVYEVAQIPQDWAVAVTGGSGVTALANGNMFHLMSDLVITMTPTTGTVYGKVVDEFGFAAEGLTVTANKTHADTTDQYGRYIITGFEGATVEKVKNQVLIEVTGKGIGKKTQTVAFAANTPVRAAQITVTGATITGTIKGRVIHSVTQEGVQGVTISDGTKARDVKTGKDGTFTKTVTAGTQVKLTASMKNKTFTPEEYPVQVQENDTISGVTFIAFEYATISGVVTKGEEGKTGYGPLAGVKVTAMTAGQPASTNASHTTLASGQFSIKVPYGTVSLKAEKEGWSFEGDAIPPARTVAPGYNWSGVEINGTGLMTATGLAAVRDTAAGTDDNNLNDLDVSWSTGPGGATEAYRVQTCVAETCGEGATGASAAGWVSAASDVTDGSNKVEDIEIDNIDFDSAFSVRVLALDNEENDGQSDYADTLVSKVLDIPAMTRKASGVTASRDPGAEPDELVIDWTRIGAENSRTSERIAIGFDDDKGVTTWYVLDANPTASNWDTATTPEGDGEWRVDWRLAEFTSDLSATLVPAAVTTPVTPDLTVTQALLDGEFKIRVDRRQDASEDWKSSAVVTVPEKS